MRAKPSVQQRRIVIGAALCAVAFVLVGVRLADVALFPPDAATARSGRGAWVPRADIVDRNGELMARDMPVYDFYAAPRAFADANDAARRVAGVIGDEARLRRIFSGRHPYVLVARKIAASERAALQGLNLPGLEFDIGGKRLYPDGRLGAQVVGVTDIDGKGISGLELGLDAQLRSARPGGAVATSLDARIAFVLARGLKAAMTEFRARAAGALVMDVRSGEVLGLASLPDFNPNDRRFGAGDSMRNIMVQDVYELGSVFKIFAFAQALDENSVTLDETLPIGTGLEIGKYTIRDAEKMPAQMTARDIFAHSSNIGTAHIAMRTGSARQRAFLEKLGLLSRLKTELAESARPLFPEPGRWGEVETATISYGHGISVSPLAFAAAAAAIVNGGRRVTPTFLKRGGDARGERVISEAASAKMNALLRFVVSDGTGRKADVAGYDIGGKTGSAEKPGKHGYHEHKLITSFCAVFPSDRPRYLLLVMLDEPHGTKRTAGFALAGHTAAPLAGQIIARIAPLLGMPMRASPGVAENS